MRNIVIPSGARRPSALIRCEHVMLKYCLRIQNAFHEGPRWNYATMCFKNFLLYFTFACILRVGSCLWGLAALISCEHVVLDGCLGAKRAP